MLVSIYSDKLTVMFSTRHAVCSTFSSSDCFYHCIDVVLLFIGGGHSCGFRMRVTFILCIDVVCLFPFKIWYIIVCGHGHVICFISFMLFYCYSYDHTKCLPMFGFPWRTMLHICFVASAMCYFMIEFSLIQRYQLCDTALHPFWKCGYWEIDYYVVAF